MTDNTISPKELPLDKVKVTDTFWNQYRALIRDVVIPYQWDALNDRIDDAEPSHAIENFNIAAGRSSGAFYGMVFQDSDVAKWLEAVAYLLHTRKDPELEKTADELIDLIASVQEEDGYLNTYFKVKEPGHRWTNLAECHELYCAGHLIEAAVAYYNATGKDKILSVACRLADCIDSVLGKEPDKLKGYPGHPEIELALMRLYEVTGNTRYMALTRYFVEQRGEQPHYYDIEYEKRGKTHHYDGNGPAWMIKDKAYSQSHQLISEQTKAVGHAVRFVYLYAGVAHLARLSGDKSKYETCKKVWANMVNRQMYVTGGIGSQGWGESFSSDYDLPNDTAYTETCASIGMIFFAHRMLQIEHDSQYADVIERALFNTVLAGMALDGKHFFYVNPLEVHPKSIPFNHKYDHVKPVRQRWFGCACCPPNISRLLSSLGQYIYTVEQETLFVDLYIASQAEILINKHLVKLTQTGNYPWDGAVSLAIDVESPIGYTLAVRIPDWCSHAQLTVNGEAYDFSSSVRRGYAYITREWSKGDVVKLNLPMGVHRIKGHPLLRHVAGLVALQRGPLVYCLEQADNGAELHNIVLPPQADLNVIPGAGLFGNQSVIKADGLRMDNDTDKEIPLYRYDPLPDRGSSQALTFIPYFSWANRGEGEMRVWVREQ